MPARIPTRNLSKRFKVHIEKTRSHIDDKFERNIKPMRHRVATDLATGKRIFPDRRRLNPSFAGRLGKEKSIEGTAEQLYVNHGVESRGLGTRSRRRSKH